MSAFEFGGLAAILMAVDFIVMVHAAAVVLPYYALAATVGSHCLESIQKEAMHLSSNPAKMRAAYEPHEISTETPLRMRSLNERTPFEGVLPHAPAPVAANIQKTRSRRSSWKSMLGIPEDEPSLKKLESMPKPSPAPYEEHLETQTSLSMLLGGYHRQRLIEAQETEDSVTSLATEEDEEPSANCDAAVHRTVEIGLEGDDDSSAGRQSLDEDQRKRAASMPVMVTMNSVYTMQECEEEEREEEEVSPFAAEADKSLDRKPPVKSGSRQRERRGSLPASPPSHQEVEDMKEEEKRKRRFSLEAQSPRRSISDIFELPAASPLQPRSMSVTDLSNMVTIEEDSGQIIEQKLAIDAKVVECVSQFDSKEVATAEEVVVDLETQRAQNVDFENAPTSIVDNVMGADRHEDNGSVVGKYAAEDFVVADVDASSIAISPRSIEVMDDAVNHPF